MLVVVLRKLFLISSLALLPGACYTMAPVELEEVKPGEAVRTRISRDGANRLTEVLGRTDPVLEGTVLENGPDGLLMDVIVATRQVGFRFEPMGQRVRVDVGEVLEMERSELDRWKTTGLAAVIGATVGIIAWNVFSGDTGGGQNDPSGGDVSDATVLRIGFRTR
jgi:hypothetical protein